MPEAEGDSRETQRMEGGTPPHGRTAARSSGMSPGEQLGHFTLLERIGEGGFGIVWLAEQREPVRRRVALKVIKPGMDSKQVLARFEAERQALALMDHPNIARVLDAGTTDRGQPFFAMEFVKGVPITTYCDQHNLSTKERLELFIPICNAVQHAHQKGVIHRDIKPSNILVTVADDKPVPKVIDFGIAKALHQKLSENTIFTAHGQLIGTPEYMSPEQAEMSGLDVDTRTDIYSLGAVLYELLTGTVPHNPESLRAKGLSEIHRIIREVDPPKPSTRLSELGDKTAHVARHHSAEVGTLRKQLRGDLDWIILKAMDKDRTRRYETANGLGLDIQRHLNDEPVSAGPPSAQYRIGKFIKRNRVGVTAATAIAAALLISTAIAVWGLSRALESAEEARTERDAARAARQSEAQQRERAQLAEREALAEAERARHVSDFMEDVLRSPSPFRDLGGLTLNTLLDEAAKNVAAKLGQYPADEARIRATLGRTYNDAGEYASAEVQLRRAIDLYAAMGADGAESRFKAISDLHRTLKSLGQTEELLEIGAAAVREAEQADIAPSVRGFLYARHAVTLKDLGRFEEGLHFAQSGYELLKQDRGEMDEDTLFARYVLALQLTHLHRLDEAVGHFRRVIQYRQELFGTGSPQAAAGMVGLAFALRFQGQYSESAETAREAIRINQQAFGDNNWSTRIAKDVLCDTLSESGSWEELFALAHAELDLTIEQLGESHHRAAELAAVVAQAANALGRTAEATEACALLLRTLPNRTPGEHADAAALNQFAWDIARSGCLQVLDAVDRSRTAEAAIDSAERAVALSRQRSDPATWWYLDTLASLCALTGDAARAVEVQREAVRLAEAAGEQRSPSHLRAVEKLAAYEAAAAQVHPIDQTTDDR